MVKYGSYWCTMAKHMASTATKMVRRSISVPAEVDKRVQSVAEQQKRSANQVYQLVIEKGLETREAEERRFRELAHRLQTTSDPAEVERLKEELGRMIFGN